MDLIGSILTGLPVFIILLGPLMFIHELGHFLAAKRAGIRVEEFGMGFPPRALLLFRRGGTDYTLNWLPIGAFVKMTGEEDPTDLRSFAAQPKRWRLITLAAGPIMNFIGGFVILTLAYSLFFTQPTEYTYRVMSTNPGGPAEQLGLQPGDTFISVNGVNMTQKLDLQSHTQPQVNALRDQSAQSIGKGIMVVVDRVSDGKHQTVTLTGTLPPNANHAAPLGVRLSLPVTKSEHVPIGLPDSMGLATNDISTALENIVRAPIDLIQQHVPLSQARPVGVIGITTIGVALIEERDIQGLFPFVRFAGFLSIILGITNLLPIPALDGGRILFIVIEALRGKRIDPRREQWVHAVGMMILIGLSAVIVVLDIVQPVAIR